MKKLYYVVMKVGDKIQVQDMDITLEYTQRCVHDIEHIKKGTFNYLGIYGVVYNVPDQPIVIEQLYSSSINFNKFSQRITGEWFEMYVTNTHTENKNGISWK